MDSVAVSMVNAAGERRPIYTATLDGPGWGTFSDHHSFALERDETWQLVVEGTLNGQPMPPARAGHFNPRPKADRSQITWSITEIRYAHAYMSLSSFCALSAGLLFCCGGMLLSAGRGAIHPHREPLSGDPPTP